MTAESVVSRYLRAAREHLGMEVAFVGEIVNGERVFRYVDSGEGVEIIEAGGRNPVAESYCDHVVKGRLPELMVDPMEHPLAAALPATTKVPVGTHVSVPIRFSDGRLYGTFCCFSTTVDSSISVHHLAAVRMMAELVGEHLEAIDDAVRGRSDRRLVIESVLGDPDAMHMVFQPLWDLDAGQVVAVEALARFPGHHEGPQWFFSEGFACGLGIELEMRAVRLALAALEQIPEAISLNVNVSPETLCDRSFLDALADAPAHRTVVEVTEHAMIDDYAEVKVASAALRALGARLAIDDVGMGFSGLNRILESAPQELKLDAVVIRDVHNDPVKQALIEAFCSFGSRVGFSVVAEGIESEAELRALRRLGVTIGQGYHLCGPGPLAAVLSRTARWAPSPGP